MITISMWKCLKRFSLKNEISFVDKIDYKVMKEYIKQIRVQPDGRITTVFINNAEITNGGAENAS